MVFLGGNMEFLKKMKSREIIEMSLKTAAAVIVGLILVLLMEGMIFNIYMDKIKENTTSQYAPADCVAYCEEIGEDEYRVYLYNNSANSWQTKQFNSSHQNIKETQYNKVVWDSPNAFDVSITGTHYVVISIFIASIIGFYSWRFYKLNQEYAKFEKRFKKTGKIFA